VLCYAVWLLFTQAFVKLESLPSIPKDRREAYADLAISIFQQFAPADPYSLTEGREQQHGSAAAATAAAAGHKVKGKDRQDSLGLDDVHSNKDQVRAYASDFAY